MTRRVFSAFRYLRVTFYSSQSIKNLSIKQHGNGSKERKKRLYKAQLKARTFPCLLCLLHSFVDFKMKLSELKPITRSSVHLSCSRASAIPNRNDISCKLFAPFVRLTERGILKMCRGQVLSYSDAERSESRNNNCRATMVIQSSYQSFRNGSER